MYGFFPDLSSRLIRDACRKDADHLGIEGAFDLQGKQFSYSFFPAAVENDVRSGHQMRAIRMGHKVSPVWGTDNPRAIALGQLTQCLKQIIDEREIIGGQKWRNDLVTVRLRYAARIMARKIKLDLSLPIPSLEKLLSPYRDHLLLSADQKDSVPIHRLLEDLAWLRRNGSSHLDLWWDIPRGDPMKPDFDFAALSTLIDIHWRRAQEIYAEVVEASFGKIAKNLPFYSSMPFRFNVRVQPESDERGRGATWYPLPAQNWAEAGADVIIEDDFARETREILEEAKEKMRKNGRPEAPLSWTMGSLRPFGGTGAMSGETSALRQALKFLAEDLNVLFQDAPSTLSGIKFR